MTKKLQHCFNCGEELGVYDAYPGDLQTCGKTECEREARSAEQGERDDRADRASQDDFQRY